MNVLGLSYEQCYGTDEQKNTLTEIVSPKTGEKASAREVMQFVGTDFFRSIYPNIWADATIRKIQQEKPALAIICDCRFPNEVAAVKSAGGKTIRLTRNEDSSDAHESETALDKDNFDWDKFDLILDNKTLSMESQNKSLYETLKKWNWLALDISEGT